MDAGIHMGSPVKRFRSQRAFSASRIVFDALTSQRSYKQSMSYDRRAGDHAARCGRAFDPELFEVFERVIVGREAPGTTTASGDAPAALAQRPGRDDLTELPLRRACTAAATRLLAARRRDGASASLLYLKVSGVDAMKQRLGQVRADDVLATVASVLRRASRRVDVLARFGADDFVFLVGDATTEQALSVAGRVRAQLTDGLAGSSDVAPIAIGIATAPEHGDSLDALVAAARRAVTDTARTCMQCARDRRWRRGAAPPRARAVRGESRRTASSRATVRHRRAWRCARRDGRWFERYRQDFARVATHARCAAARRGLRRRHLQGVLVPDTARPVDRDRRRASRRSRGARAPLACPARLVPSLASTQRSLHLADDDATGDEATVVDEIYELISAAAASVHSSWSSTTSSMLTVRRGT
jgi:diguanylate cyclase (GGDEF)-like protein